MDIQKQLEGWKVQIQVCMQHEFSDLFVRQSNKTAQPGELRVMENGFVSDLVVYGGFELEEAKLMVWAAKARGRQYVKEHKERNPEGVGVGSGYLRMCLEQYVAPLREIAASSN